jgi:hypothetical protein
MAGAVAALLVWSGGGTALADQRVEIPDAGLAMTVPADWTVQHKRDPIEPALPPEYADVSAAVGWSVLTVSMPGTEGFCGLTMYEDMPMGFEDWALYGEPEAHGTFTSRVELPIGDAVRLVDDPEAYPDDRVIPFLHPTMYVFESGGTLFEFGCLSAEPSDDLWMSLAETIEPLGGLPPSTDAAVIASLDLVAGFDSVVEVADGLFMSADCELALWVAYEDDTFKEWLACELGDEPVDDPEEQGNPPTETVTTTGGACEWVSDYWAVTDGSEVWADGYEMTVTPEGRVFGSSTYGSDMLDCSDG